MGTLEWTQKMPKTLDPQAFLGFSCQQMQLALLVKETVLLCLGPLNKLTWAVTLQWDTFFSLRLTPTTSFLL